MVDGLFAFVDFEVAFGFVCLDCPIVHKNLVPGPFSVGRAGVNSLGEVLTAFKVGVGINDYAAVAKPLVVNNLAHPK